MAFGLGNLFSGQPNIRTDDRMAQQAVQGQSAGRVNPAQQAALPKPGSIISGQVTDTGGETVTITTDSGQSIQARMEDGVNLLKGSYVSFEVSKASPEQISLKALFTNTAAGSSTMSGALLQAGISENAASYGMVRQMMENGMPIDKNSLVSMYRQVMAHPEADSAGIVDMTKLSIPLTDENVNQFRAYRNLEHHINEAVNDVTDSLSGVLDDLMTSPGKTEGLELVRDLARILSDQAAPETTGAGENGGENAFIKLIDESLAAREESGAVNGQQTGENTGAMQAAGKEGASEPSASAGEAFLKALKAAADPEAAKAGTEAVKMQEKPGSAGESPAAVNKTVTVIREDETDAAGRAAEKKAVISQDPKSDDGSLSKLTEGRSGSEALKQIAEGIEKLLSEKQTPENAARLMKAQTLLAGKDIQQLISGELSRQWKMDAGDISSKEDVQNFYNKLRSQTRAIAESVHKTAGDDNTLFRQVENIRQNVDFMDQLNKAASYVQLPLHLSGEDAHGDLYVYTDKKSLAQNNGKISAFLHLDMDTMGPVDVYVAMEHEKVSTNFYLKDDEMIDFISENIHILDERLADLGYDAGIKVSLKEKGKPANVMDEIMEDHRDGFLIGHNSFNVLA